MSHITAKDLFQSLYVEEETYAEHLFARGKEMTSAAFEIGEMVAKAIEHVEKYNIEIGRMDIYQEAAGLVGLESARTIEYYVETYKFYPEEIREVYSGLRYTIFKNAMGYEFWEDILAFAQRWADDHEGKNPTWNWLISQFQSQIQGYQSNRLEPELDNPIEAIEESISFSEAYAEDNPEQREEQEIHNQPFYSGIIQRALGVLKDTAEKLHLDFEKWQRVNELLERLEMELRNVEETEF